MQLVPHNLNLGLITSTTLSTKQGQIECLATGETFDFSDLRKVFIS